MIKSYLAFGFSFSSKKVLDAQSISQTLNIQPTSSKNPGDPMGQRKDGVIFGYWEYSTENKAAIHDNSDVEKSLNPHFEHLSQLFLPHQASILTIKTVMPAQLSLTVKWLTDQIGQEHGPILSKRHLEICQNLSIDTLRFSLDTPDTDEINELELCSKCIKYKKTPTW